MTFLFAEEASSSGSWGLLVFYVLISLIFSFLCSIAEAVLLSVTQPFVQNLKRTKPSAGARWSRLKKDVDRPLAAILTLNTIAHTVGATLAGTQAGLIFHKDFAGPLGITGAIAMGIFSAVFTLLILIGSEIIPKTIGATYWKALAPATAVAIDWLIFLLSPFVWLSKAITKRFGGGGHGTSFSREELQAMAEIASQQGHMDEQESTMLRNLLLFRDTTVGSIMTPRTVVFMLPDDCTVGEFVENHMDQPFSRVPLYKENRDHVLGFALRIQILHAHALGEKDRKLAELLQPIRSVRADTTVLALLARMTGKRAHISLVVDEFGSLQGIVTLEDLVETLVGFEIVDETDTNADMQLVARRLWEKRAKLVGIKDLEESKESESHL